MSFSQKGSWSHCFQRRIIVVGVPHTSTLLLIILIALHSLGEFG